VKLTVIAAISADGFLADATGRIPWHMPRDIAHFRQHCAGKHLLVGRKTADQMHGWFAEMEASGMAVFPIILTRNPPGDQASSLTRGTGILPAPSAPASSVEAAIRIAKQNHATELLVCGGAEVYRCCLPLAQSLILTTIHCQVQQGTRFPDFSTNEWKIAAKQSWKPDSEHDHGMEITEYFRGGC
jgi:dihydrofolate reductase